MNRRKYTQVSIAAMAALCICGAARAEDEAVAVAFGEGKKLSMQIPKSWKQGEAGGMRAFQAKTPKQGDDPEDGELLVFIFPAGGSVEANLDRWSKQMGGAEAKKTTVKTAAGKEAIMAEMEGTYTAMSPGGAKGEPKAGYKMLGAILQTDLGGVFIKLTGPKGSIDAQKAAFDKMVQSFK